MTTMTNQQVQAQREVRASRPLSYTLEQKYMFARIQRNGDTIVITRRADNHEIRILRISR